jgi:hypothetical protein
MNEEQFDQLISLKIQHIIKAAEDMHNNYGKSAAYIDRTIWNIVEASIKQGQSCMVNELFGGE